MSSPAQQPVPGIETNVLRPTRQVGALLGFVVKAEADAIFRQQPFETADGTDPLELWRKFELQRQTLPPLGAAEAEALPGSLKSAIDLIRKRQTYKRHYEAVADYSFMAVPINALLTPQWHADLDFVGEIAATTGIHMTQEEQLFFAMSEGKITEPIVTGNQVWFTSPRRDLHADSVPVVRETGEGEFEIVVKAASRPNYVQVAVLNNRLFLTNGVHKVCALNKLGYSHCICVLRKANQVAELGIDPHGTSLLRDQVFLSPRPALVSDFLNPLAAAPLKMRPMYQCLQVAVSVGMIQVPALMK